MSRNHWGVTLVVCAFAGVDIGKAMGEPAEQGKQSPAAASKDSRTPDPATVEKLTPEEARQLTASAGAELSLPRLRDLSVEAARELATYREQSKTIRFTVMIAGTKQLEQTYTEMVPYKEEVTLEDGTKQIVEKSRQEERTRTVTVNTCHPEERVRVFPVRLCLDALEEPSPGVLAELAKHNGDVRLAMRTLSPKQAQELAAHKGGRLVLERLTSLDAEAAGVLAAREGDLSLNGLATLSDEAAKSLAKQQGHLSLNGLTTLSDEAAKVLRANPSIRLPDNFRR